MLKRKVHNTKEYKAPEPTYTLVKSTHAPGSCTWGNAKRVKARGKYANKGRATHGDGTGRP